MPLTAVFNVKPQNDGVTHANRDAGGALVLPEAVTAAYSPGQGVVPGAITGDFRAGAAHPASVFGTGDNPDRLVLTGEAV
jgi:hypothetical protein